MTQSVVMVETPGPMPAVAGIVAYRRELAESCRELDFGFLARPELRAASRVALNDVFVEPAVREKPAPPDVAREVWKQIQQQGDLIGQEVPFGMTAEQLDRMLKFVGDAPRIPVFDAVCHPQCRRVVILGRSGAGKTTLARYVALSLVSDTAGSRRIRESLPDCLPLLIDLRFYLPRCYRDKSRVPLDFLDYVARFAESHPDADEIRKLATAGRLVLILDGLDEVFEPGEREKVVQHIAAVNPPGMRVVVTTRATGYRPDVLRAAGFRHYALEDFTAHQIEEFADKWYAAARPEDAGAANAGRTRLLDNIRRSRRLRLQAGNPLLLTVMAAIPSWHDFPRERGQLLEYALELLIDRWAVRHHLAREGLPVFDVGREEKRAILTRLARLMHEQRGTGLGNFITPEDLQQVFRYYLCERFHLRTSDGQAPAQAMLKGLEFDGGLLVRPGPDFFTLQHRVFLEYGCALLHFERQNNDPAYTFEQMVKDVFDRYWQNPNWHDTLGLLCGMYGEGFAARIIDRLDRAEPWPGFPDQPPWNYRLVLAFLAGLHASGTDAAHATAHLERLRDLLSRFGIAWGNRDFIDDCIYLAGQVAACWPPPDFSKLWLTGRTPLLSETDVDLRRWGMMIIARLNHDLPQARQYLKERARSDENPFIRSTAIFELAHGWPDDPDLVPLLKNRANTDPVPQVQELARSELARFAPDDPEVKAMLELAGWRT